MTPTATKPPLSVWAIAERKRLGWKPADVARIADVSELTVRGWESGRPIGADRIPLLEAAFGSDAPGRPAQRQSVDLAAAITLQARAIDRLAGQVEQLLARRDEDLRDLARTLADLLRSTPAMPQGAAEPAAARRRSSRQDRETE